ncbi:hypothetical protein V2J09_009086 [Rumex salicifolius]
MFVYHSSSILITGDLLPSHLQPCLWVLAGQQLQLSTRWLDNYTDFPLFDCQLGSTSDSCLTLFYTIYHHTHERLQGLSQCLWCKKLSVRTRMGLQMATHNRGGRSTMALIRRG